jgi:arylsulfatase A-like enzyme
VGKILDRLKELKIDDNTIVMFTSDNGPHKEGGVDPKFFESSGLLRGIKRDLYEGGIRVPMVVRWPAKIKPGRVSDLVWAFWDFLPTACQIAGVSPPPKLDGLSMLPGLLGQTQSTRHNYLYWEFHEGGFKQALRLGDWKAVRLQADGPLKLYDLQIDLGEKHNVADKYSQVVARIEKFMKSARADSAEFPVQKTAEKKETRPAARPGHD